MEERIEIPFSSDTQDSLYFNYRTFQHKTRIFTLSDRRKEDRRKANLSISFPERRIKERRMTERRKQKTQIHQANFTVSDRLKKNSERLWDFYLNSNFLYEGKLNFLQPVKNEVLDTIEKLLNCQDDTCKLIFILNAQEIIGSVMAVQYTNDTWMVQHIVTSARHTLLAKELILEIVNWMIKNKKMYYFINYFQEKTRWAYKTYGSIIDYIGGTSIAIDKFDFCYIKLSDFNQSSRNQISILELQTNNTDYKYVYQQLLQRERVILVNTLGLKENLFSTDLAEENYKKLGLYRKRRYLVASAENRIIGFALMDISSYGISLSLLFNVFYIFIFDDNKKEEIYYAFINRINQILIEHKRIYSICITKPQDSIFLEKIGYQHSRTYFTFTFSRDNGQFEKILNFISIGRK